MVVRLTLISLFLVANTACTKTVVVKEKNPLLVTAAPPVKKQEAPPPPPPPRVEVKKEKIQVNEKIHFEFNKAVIRPESFGLLDEIAKVITEHPEILKIRIEGHTDSVGTRPYNLKLSKQRAQAVREYLAKKGIAGTRLLTEGYAFDKAIASNDTEDGRAKNRRVEFNIIERSDEASAGGNGTSATGADGKTTTDPGEGKVATGDKDGDKSKTAPAAATDKPAAKPDGAKDDAATTEPAKKEGGK